MVPGLNPHPISRRRGGWGVQKWNRRRRRGEGVPLSLFQMAGWGQGRPKDCEGTLPGGGKHLSVFLIWWGGGVSILFQFILLDAVPDLDRVGGGGGGGGLWIDSGIRNHNHPLLFYAIHFFGLSLKLFSSYLRRHYTLILRTNARRKKRRNFKIYNSKWVRHRALGELRKFI